MKIALHLEFHVGGMASHNRVTYILPDVWPQNQRQIAVHTRAVSPAQASLQIQNAGKARCTGGFVGFTGLPLELRLAFGVSVGELQTGRLQRNFFTLNGPQHFR